MCDFSTITSHSMTRCHGHLHWNGAARIIRPPMRRMGVPRLTRKSGPVFEIGSLFSNRTFFPSLTFTSSLTVLIHTSDLRSDLLSCPRSKTMSYFTQKRTFLSLGVRGATPDLHTPIISPTRMETPCRRAPVGNF